MKSVYSMVSIGLLAIGMSACVAPSSGGASAGTSSGGSGGSSSELTAASLGTGGYNGQGDFQETCINIGGASTYGTSLTSYSILKTIDFSSNGNYNLSARFMDSTNCTGTEAFVYTQFGTFTVGSALSNPSGAYEIEYTATSDQFTVYGQYFNGAWATVFNNTNCHGSLGTNFSTTAASSSQSAAGITCNTQGINLTFPPLGNFYDIIIPDSVTTTGQFYASPSISVFYMGQFSTYPTTATVLFNN
jgi:hypothetical protein